MPELKYKRVLLKFSGEALAGKMGFGIQPAMIRQLTEEIIAAQELGAQIGIVIGGGNIFRGLSAGAQDMDRVRADYMGMLATVINGLALQDALLNRGVACRLFSAIRMEEVAEPMHIRRAKEYLGKGEVLIFSSGTGRPYFSTDSGAALRAAEIGAQVLIKGTKVKGVYDKDPVHYKDAQLYRQLDYQVALEKKLRVMDLTAFSICRDNRIPIIVYNMLQAGNLKKILTGESVGTLVSQGVKND